MENPWKTTPLEDTLIILFMLCCFVAFALLLIALALTHAAFIGRFSRSAIIFYWCYALVSALLWLCGFEFLALLLFAYASPFVALGMHLFARREKSKVNMISIWSEPVHGTSKQEGESE